MKVKIKGITPGMKVRYKERGVSTVVIANLFFLGASRLSRGFNKEA